MIADDSTSADNSRPSFGVLGQHETKRRKVVDEEMHSPAPEDPSRCAPSWRVVAPCKIRLAAIAGGLAVLLQSSCSPLRNTAGNVAECGEGPVAGLLRWDEVVSLDANSFHARTRSRMILSLSLRAAEIPPWHIQMHHSK